MKKQHNWITVNPNLTLEVFICQNCQGVRVKDSHTNTTIFIKELPTTVNYYEIQIQFFRKKTL